MFWRRIDIHSGFIQASFIHLPTGGLRRFISTYLWGHVIPIVWELNEGMLFEFFLHSSNIFSAKLLLDHLLWEAGMLFRHWPSLLLTGVVVWSFMENDRWDTCLGPWWDWWAIIEVLEAHIYKTATAAGWGNLVCLHFKILGLQPFLVPEDLQKQLK